MGWTMLGALGVGVWGFALFGLYHFLTGGVCE